MTRWWGGYRESEKTGGGGKGGGHLAGLWGLQVGRLPVGCVRAGVVVVVGEREKEQGTKSSDDRRSCIQDKEGLD